MEHAALVCRGRGLAIGTRAVVTARLIVALSLMLLAMAVRAQGADELLARVERHGVAAGPSAGEAQFLAELDRARTELLPDVRLQQSSHWDYSGLPDLSLGVSATVPLEEPRLRAQSELALKGLELARHNTAAERRRVLYQLRRSLRMLAHLQEMEALLERHHSLLLERAPELASLEASQAGGGGDRLAASGGLAAVGRSDEVISYLEVDLALQRTRGERRLLSEAIVRRHASAGLTIPQSGAGRPSLPPTPELNEVNGYCRVETDETRRASLAQEEEGLAAQREAAAGDLRVTLELNGDVRYMGASIRQPWQLGAGVGVNLVLPVGAGLRPSLSLSVSPSSLSQNSSLGWPGRETDPAGELRDAERQETYLESIREAELSARQAQLSFEAGHRRVRLRRAVLASLENSATPAGPRASQVAQAEPARQRASGWDQEILQARADLLGAELERDLAHMEFARACGSDEQGGWGLTP